MLARSAICSALSLTLKSGICLYDVFTASKDSVFTGLHCMVVVMGNTAQQASEALKFLCALDVILGPASMAWDAQGSPIFQCL